MRLGDKYSLMTESERHFNQIQAGIRSQASYWMLAAFGAIALLLKTDSQNPVIWLAPPAVLIGVVSCMATVGLSVLWINDQMVYQQLLNSNFISALKMEYADEQLPPVRLLDLYKEKGKGLSRRMSLYYIVPMFSFLVITIAAFLLRKSIGDTSKALIASESLWILIGLSIIQVLIIIWVITKKKEVSANSLAPAFRDPEFQKLFGEDNNAKNKKDSIENGNITKDRIASYVARFKPSKAKDTAIVDTSQEDRIKISIDASIHEKANSNATNEHIS